MVLQSGVGRGYDALMAEQTANGRLESILSKQLYVVHCYQTAPGSGCFIFDPVWVQVEALSAA
ncbi:hypothetical protein D3C80_1213060 [compost metagenome]|jgi:hypothetical protein